MPMILTPGRGLADIMLIICSPERELRRFPLGLGLAVVPTLIPLNASSSESLELAGDDVLKLLNALVLIVLLLLKFVVADGNDDAGDAPTTTLLFKVSNILPTDTAAGVAKGSVLVFDAEPKSAKPLFELEELPELEEVNGSKMEAADAEDDDEEKEEDDDDAKGSEREDDDDDDEDEEDDEDDAENGSKPLLLSLFEVENTSVE